MQDTAARKIQITRLFSGWPSAAATVDMGNVNTFVAATAEVSLEALTRSVEQFVTGKVERNNAFVPAAAELAENARAWQDALGRVATAQAVVDAQALVSYPIGAEPPEGMVALGPIEVDFGRGPINLRDKSPAEKEEILAAKGETVGGRAGLLLNLKRMGN